MAVTATQWTWQQAEEIARDLISHLDGCFERVEIAGSVRRRRPIVRDIDLVAIPVFQTDLFGNPGGAMLLDQALRDLGVIWTGGDKRRSFQWLKASVDLYLATQSTWALTLAIRTGSMEHNQYLCQVANSKDLSISYAEGLKNRTTGEVVIIRSEQELFELLDLPFVLPSEREAVRCEGYPSYRPLYLRRE